MNVWYSYQGDYINVKPVVWVSRSPVLCLFLLSTLSASKKDKGKIVIGWHRLTFVVKVVSSRSFM